MSENLTTLNSKHTLTHIAQCYNAKISLFSFLSLVVVHSPSSLVDNS